VNRGQVDPGPVLGLVSWYAAVQVCKWAGDRGGVPIYRCAMLPLISL